MAKVCVFLAEGFEEIEALTPVDLLRRAGADVTMTAVGEGREVKGSHGIGVAADAVFADMDFEDVDMIVIPGGMPGTKYLREDRRIIALVRDFDSRGKLIGAICAGPTVLCTAGIMEGRAATCFPGCESDMPGVVLSADRVVTDRNIVTSRGVGTAIPFALELIAKLYGTEKADALAKAIVYR